MPYKDREKKRAWDREYYKKRYEERRMERMEYNREWRVRAINLRKCMRCGLDLLEGEGRCCCNCSSKITRNLISIGRDIK